MVAAVLGDQVTVGGANSGEGDRSGLPVLRCRLGERILEEPGPEVLQVNSEVTHCQSLE